MCTMRRDVVSGILLITASLAGILVMGVHPAAHGALTPDQARALARLGAMVHSLAIAMVPVMFLGFLGVTRRLAPSELGVAALVAYGFAGVAVSSAAVVSGFVSTGLLEGMITADASARPTTNALLAMSSLLNQGYAKVFVVASSAAILLWSAAIWKTGRMPRAAAVAGFVVGVGVLLVFFSGILGLDVHGFGVITFAQSAWTTWIGILMLRSSESPTRP
jgi:hypothetical protein